MDEDELKPSVEGPDDEAQLEEEGTLEEGGKPKEEPEVEEEQSAIAAKEEGGPAPQEEKSEVQRRIDALTWEKNENLRKLELFKSDPDKYYETYPAERPQGYKPKAQAEETEDIEDYESMVIRGGPHDGKTLGELANERPLLAAKMLNDYLDGQKQAQKELAEKESLSRRAWENDVNSFGNNLTQDLYGKSKDELTEEEFKNVNDVIFRVDQWKTANGKQGYSYADAYALMNRDNELKQAKEGGAKKVIESLKKKPIGSVSGKTESAKASIDFESMSEDALGQYVLGLSDVEKEKFYREASTSLKDKYPSWPWD